MLCLSLYSRVACKKQFAAVCLSVVCLLSVCVCVCPRVAVWSADRTRVYVGPVPGVAVHAGLALQARQQPAQGRGQGRQGHKTQGPRRWWCGAGLWGTRSAAVHPAVKCPSCCCQCCCRSTAASCLGWWWWWCCSSSSRCCRRCGWWWGCQQGWQRFCAAGRVCKVNR